MNDTVTRLLALADEYAGSASRCEQPAEHTERKRQALEAELVRLFTPLSYEQVERMSSVAPAWSDDWVHLSSWEYKGEIERARAAGIHIAEQAHGIGDI